LPICFSPIYYRAPGSNSPSPSGQTILFGCPLELCTVGELKKIPPVLEYLLDSVRHGWSGDYFFRTHVGQKHRIMTTNPLYYKKEECWHLVNELEQAWTGVEETDRALISRHVPDHRRRTIIMVCLL